MFVNLKDVVVDQKYQSRTAMDDKMVQAYAELMRDGVKFPPVRIVHVEDQYVLVDGFHRFRATEEIGEYEIEADVTEGDWRDVRMLKWQSNTTHGKPLARDEKRRMIREMLADEECNLWSNRKIGKFVGVSHTLVNSVRVEKSAHAEKAKSGNISTPAPQAKAQSVEPQAADAEEDDEEPDDRQVMIETLIDENDKLTKQLAVSVLPEEEKVMAGQLIDDLRNEIRVLNVELESVKASRDRYQWENAELKKQVAAQQKQLKKLQG